MVRINNKHFLLHFVFYKRTNRIRHGFHSTFSEKAKGMLLIIGEGEE